VGSDNGRVKIKRGKNFFAFGQRCQTPGNFLIARKFLSSAGIGIPARKSQEILQHNSEFRH